MTENASSIARAYYSAMGHREIQRLGSYLLPSVVLKTPFGETVGKEQVLKAVEGFAQFFTGLTIREVLGGGSQAVVIYDVDFPAPMPSCPSAALVSTQAGQIERIELFYDARPFQGD